MATQHHRASSHPERPLPAHARPPKPTPLSKRASAQASNKSSQRSAQHKEEDEDGMTVSFLQYCTTCEKQIVVPNSSILYCSENCRRKDNNQVLSYSSDHSPPTTLFTNFAFDDLPVRDIVAPRSPTAAPSQHSSCAFSEASEDETTFSGDEVRLKHDSDAARYLRQFQSYTTATKPSARASRPRYNRSSTSTAALSTTPSTGSSLPHTPTSTASMSPPYTLSTRPLPPRTNPHSSSYGARSIDLVMPFAAVATTAPSSYAHHSLKSAAISKTSIGTAEGEMLYEKKPTVPSRSLGQGSLKQLFAFGAMQAPPTSTASTRPPWM